MQKRKLRNLEVSVLGLGCMGMSFSYGEAKDEKEMITLIHRAKDLGIDFFDTAEVYGPFINEELVGKAIKPFRNEVVLATKFGVRIEGAKQIVDSTLSKIRQSLEGSLKRLQTDCIDLYYQHRVDTNVPVEEVANLMSEFYKEGKIKAWGMSEAGVQSIKKAHAVFPLSAVQSEYSLWWREPEKELLKVLEELNIGFVPFSPLGKGFLAGKFNANSTFEDNDFRSQVPRFKSENLKANLDLVYALEDIAKAKNATLAQIALAWVLVQKTFIAPIFGTTNLRRLEENINAVNIDFTQEELNHLKSILEKIIIKGDRYAGEAALRVGK
ncbi:aldo/keto reductase [Campylobacter jejuni]|uniref:aldo/keto reductase n=1 Tax=Campylobacter jejuni TaxID=197 RepID=UPI000F809C59|nr:aldo/keto reductase [Campylobacter jejuni]RTK02521.1 aldo/keto reductase [Campylobacter jejuni]HEF7701008.1 aldo/keto reductase [Campylobacter jejuni]HEF7707355.1 aldo/keto reductase [Campylobacter jejuni]HEF8756500.1 aldo/keto reductase [Campylobacter jejuni]